MCKYLAQPSDNYYSTCTRDHCPPGKASYSTVLAGWFVKKNHKEAPAGKQSHFVNFLICMQPTIKCMSSAWYILDDLQKDRTVRGHQLALKSFANGLLEVREGRYIDNLWKAQYNPGNPETSLCMVAAEDQKGCRASPEGERMTSVKLVNMASEGMKYTHRSSSPTLQFPCSPRLPSTDCSHWSNTHTG